MVALYFLSVALGTSDRRLARAVLRPDERGAVLHDPRLHRDRASASRCWFVGQAGARAHEGRALTGSVRFAVVPGSAWFARAVRTAIRGRLGPMQVARAVRTAIRGRLVRARLAVSTARATDGCRGPAAASARVSRWGSTRPASSSGSREPGRGHEAIRQLADALDRRHERLTGVQEALRRPAVADAGGVPEKMMSPGRSGQTADRRATSSGTS